MRQYNGAVLFVDILGIGSLTAGNSIEINEHDFSAIGRRPKTDISNQLFCAYLLTTFRSNLKKLPQNGLKIAQLSDCAFIWSEEPNTVLDAARVLMWRNIYSGVFCRAGLSFGQIVEPDLTDRKLGRFICGDAVTRAVQLEARGKGARTFVDTELPGQSGLKFGPDAFSQLTNATDFKVIDEFAWFRFISDDAALKDKNIAIKTVNEIVKLVGLLMWSPLYRWNAATIQGKIQLGSAIERFSKEIQNISRSFDLEIDGGYYWECESFVKYVNGQRSNHAVNAFCEHLKLA